MRHENLSFFRRISTASIFALLLCFCSSYSAESSNGFFRYPHSDGKSVVFTSEGDLWLVSISGGTAVRLTTHEGEERFAHCSPDGKWIAFSGQEDGHDDVFVIPASGGVPKRLTFHPGSDGVIGWNPKGEVLFRSSREAPYRAYRIYTVPVEGGFPQSIGLDKGSLISYEPNGDRIAYNRYSREFRKWKRYKGGWAQDIWVSNLNKKSFKNITDNPPLNDWDGTDAFPMWHSDGRIYFLSDRDGRANIHSMKPDGSDIKQHTKHTDFDIRFPALGNGIIVYQYGMDIYAYNIAQNSDRKIDISLPSDRIQARDKYADPKQYITSFSLSPDGKRVLFCSRGELFTLPAKKEGLIRQLTRSSGEREKFPSWSPDGTTIAAWSDASGDEKLYLYPAEGGDAKLLGTDNEGWHFGPSWSPDGKMLAFGNQKHELVVMDSKNGKTNVIDSGQWEISEYNWSADSRFLVYSRNEINHNNTIQVWDSKKKKVYPVTDDFYNSSSPQFDPEGKYLYFLSDRTANPLIDFQEELFIRDKATRPYVVTLKKGEKLPFTFDVDPEDDDNEWDKWGKKDDDGDEEEDKDQDDDKKGKKEPVQIEIDFEGISDRIAPIPVPAGNYYGLDAVKNKIFYLSFENDGMVRDEFDEDKRRGVPLHKFNLKKKKHSIVDDAVNGYDISDDGKRMLIRKRDQFMVVGIDEKPGGGHEMIGKDKDEQDNKNVDLSDWDLRIDIRAEWKQMFFESWRLQRDFFWDYNMHYVDWEQVRDQYAPLADRISTRDELSDLIGEMFAELNCSHTYVWGGDQRRADYHSTGLLGVDVSKHKSGFFRIDRVIAGREWKNDLSSPLAAPHINAQVGEYIVAINGRSCAEAANIYELLLNRADKITSVTLNSKPSLDGGREVIIKPLGSERGLRYYDWVDDRHQYVHEKSDGKIGYIHLTNMGSAGLSQFTGSYAQQHQKQGLIMDVRYNGGGWVAEMILSHLGRQVFGLGMSRNGGRYRRPNTGFYGHMAAVSNGETGSDGETFTEGFRRLGLGPIIGTRTWGGWVGIRADKPLIDRGMITQPEFTGWGVSDGEWMIEGWGTEPDEGFEVKEDPASFYRGDDPQLDRAIEYLMDKIKNDPKPLPPMPEYPKDRGYKK